MLMRQPDDGGKKSDDDDDDDDDDGEISLLLDIVQSNLLNANINGNEATRAADSSAAVHEIWRGGVIVLRVHFAQKVIESVG